MTIGFTELAWTLLWSGAPIYLAAGALQGFALHRGGLAPSAIIATIGLSVVLTVLAGVVIWGRVFGPTEIMAWGFFNMPAAFASLIMFPLVGGMIYASFGD